MAVVVRILAVVAYVAMLLSFGLLGAWAANAPALSRTVDRGPQVSVPWALAVDLSLVAFFAVGHSLMAREGCKRVMRRLVPAASERSVFVLVASLQLAVLCRLWLPVAASPLWMLNGVGRWLVSGVCAAGALLLVASTFMMDHLELTGLRQAFGRGGAPAGLRRPWLYAHVRHPIYLGALVVIWAAPSMTASRLLLSMAFTLYVVVGVRLEERDLLRSFGDEYRRYRREVPMLLPWPRRRHTA